MGEKERLRNNSQFAAVYERGRMWANEFAVLKTLPNGL
jgi:RNase P protein component